MVEELVILLEHIYRIWLVGVVSERPSIFEELSPFVCAKGVQPIKLILNDGIQILIRVWVPF